MIKTIKRDDITIVSFDKIDRITALIYDTLKEELKNIFQKSPKMILNLEGIKYIDSTGFGIFLSLLKMANNNTGQFKICNISQEVMSLFKLLQLHNIFELYDNLDDCLKSFN